MRKVAYIGTGGTIASVGTGPFDLLDYSATGERVDSAELVKRTGLDKTFAHIHPVDFRRIDSTAITAEDWADLADLCLQISQDSQIEGIVIGHGTATLEETAWVLSLTLDLRLPVVLTGSMRPLSGISSDAGANLAAALRVAVSPQADPGHVYVVLNGEIHDPREATKSHTLRLDAFRSPEFGPLGRIEGTHVNFARRIARRTRRAPFATGLLRHLPRVDIVYSHVGADGRAIELLADAGAKGIVSAGFGPGQGTPGEIAALGRVVRKGVVVVQSSRTGAGQVVDSTHHRALGIIAGGALNPQKARILLALCLAQGDDKQLIAQRFQSV